MTHHHPVTSSTRGRRAHATTATLTMGGTALAPTPTAHQPPGSSGSGCSLFLNSIPRPARWQRTSRSGRAHPLHAPIEPFPHRLVVSCSTASGASRPILPLRCWASLLFGFDACGWLLAHQVVGAHGGEWPSVIRLVRRRLAAHRRGMHIERPGDLVRPPRLPHRCRSYDPAPRRHEPRQLGVGDATTGGSVGAASSADRLAGRFGGRVVVRMSMMVRWVEASTATGRPRRPRPRARRVRPRQRRLLRAARSRSPAPPPHRSAASTDMTARPRARPRRRWTPRSRHDLDQRPRPRLPGTRQVCQCC